MIHQFMIKSILYEYTHVKINMITPTTIKIYKVSNIKMLIIIIVVVIIIIYKLNR